MTNAQAYYTNNRDKNFTIKLLKKYFFPTKCVYEGARALSLTTLIIMKLSIMVLFVTLSIIDI